MALSQSTLKTAIKSASAQAKAASNVDNAEDVFADKLAQAIYNWILTAQVNVTVTVTTAGSATNQAGGGTGTGTIS